VKQILKNLLHFLLVFPEGGPAFLGEAEHGMGFLAHKFCTNLLETKTERSRNPSDHCSKFQKQ